MAHNIHYNQQTGKHSFFSVKEKAWHNLGTIVEDYPTSSEAIQFAGLDYTVEKRPLFTLDHFNQSSEGFEQKKVTIEVPNHFATVRTDTEEVLGVVGKEYKVVQNWDAFTFFDAIVGGEGIFYETAGALGKGERIFITAKLPDYIQVGRGDLIEKYLFLTTSHDGLGSITAAFTPIRIVCNNTLHAALQNCLNSIKIRHTQNAKERLEQAHKVMGISNKLSKQLEQIFNHWAKVPIRDEMIKKLIEKALAPNKEVLNLLQEEKRELLSTCYKNMCTAAYEYALSSPTQQTETTKGTVFGAYNAITGYFQNVRNYGSEEAKLKSLILGGIAQIKTATAFHLCTSFAKNGKVEFLN